MVKVPVSLQQSKSAGVSITKRGYFDVLRIVQRSPEMFTGTGPNRQAVGIMDFRAPIDSGRLLGFGKPIHRSGGRTPEPLHVFSQEKRGLHLHNDTLGPV